MTSNLDQASEAFVWIWLPESPTPVVAGRITQDADRFVFNYGASYLERKDAIPIYAPELPLRRGIIEPEAGLSMASCIRDGSPDAWGRRVIINRLVGAKASEAEVGNITEISYLLASGSDRIGALDFQASATEYVPRQKSEATYEELIEAASLIEKGVPLTPGLDQALNHGTSIGGARPKALIDRGDRKLIAKFSASGDLYSVVKAEFIAMKLAAACGLDVAPVSMIEAGGKDVLLIERFDRTRAGEDWHRKAMVSALTILGLDEMMARYASYEDLAEIIRHRFAKPKETLRELFGRICFNVLCGNTDDHARNHAAFWDGKMLTLSPAYDICPQGRTGNEATQAMLIKGDNRMSTLANCLAAAPDFLLTDEEAVDIITQQIITIAGEWDAVCDLANLSAIDKVLFGGRQFLNPYCIDGLTSDHDALPNKFARLRAQLLA
ncbi:type II toxin-antitoxin system HipA family toxin [Meridianimarinicoccus aquatilis]|uniref:Type II toxin-antitoxin system HipA family toxin n=1 Tax=Meridianimarinicoccus aquatilis TaxID=2552766 RepID=A0A4V3BAW9_9RHOB|nr:type II toxin-antitoxin system HipA family toxin [Fluviibacterium aquatile]TDL84879.1 type II toxin-antitoxin system HipA family toxin [Fluviibacterium aquatile]